MKKNWLYTLTLAGISVAVLIISLLSFEYLYSSAKEKLWKSKLESGEREAREISRLLEQQLRSGLSKTKIIQNLQVSIQNTDVKSDFICMYNKEGIELCHPNPALVGQKIQEANSRITGSNDAKIKTLKMVLEQGEISSGLRTFPNNPGRSSEIVNIYPVEGTDWMVASHANLSVLEEELADLRLQFILSLILSTLLISGSSYIIIRLLYRRYETSLEAENKILNDKVNELHILNLHLNANREKLKSPSAAAPLNELSKDSETAKKRFLTYHKDELVKVESQDIAYFYLDNGITYLYTFGGRQLTSTNSLDEIIKWLDQTSFYRANRQFIVNIRAINSILLYGKNQLKLVIKPTVNMDVIVSKNKAAEFKQWLDQ